MKGNIFLICGYSILLNGSPAFRPIVRRSSKQSLSFQECRLARQDFENTMPPSSDLETLPSRRDFVKSVGTLAIIGGSLIESPGNAGADQDVGQERVLVLGGTGFVGSSVVEVLTGRGIQVVATSRDGREGTTAFDITKASDTEIRKLTSGFSAVISCVGAIGTANDKAVNAGTGRVAQISADSGVKRFVYVSVAPEVKEFAKDIDFLKGYMEGKDFSRSSVLNAFPSGTTLIEPTFIYGGGSFELNPPRVASFYGSFIESLLSSSPLRTVERVLSPGIIKIALEPPVPVEDVAKAAVLGALRTTGRESVILDSYDKIKQAANRE